MIPEVVVVTEAIPDTVVRQHDEAVHVSTKPAEQVVYPLVHGPKAIWLVRVDVACHVKHVGVDADDLGVSATHCRQPAKLLPGVRPESTVELSDGKVTCFRLATPSPGLSEMRRIGQSRPAEQLVEGMIVGVGGLHGSGRTAGSYQSTERRANV